MIRLSLLLATALAAACSPSSTGDTTSGEGSLVSEGRALAETHCASCHAIDTSSPSPHAEAPAFRTLSQRYPVENLQEALVEGIIVGHTDMPEFTFEPGEADALIAFLESLQADES